MTFDDSSQVKNFPRINLIPVIVAPDPPTYEITRAGIVPKLVEFSRSDHVTLQWEALWTLVNITAARGGPTRAVIEAGGIPILIDLISSNHEDVQEQAVWALGNIAGESAECRDLVLDSGAMGPLLR